MAPLRHPSGRVLFFFPHEAAAMIAEVEAGAIPRERLYGFLELRERGWDVSIVDRRFRHGFGAVNRFLRRYGLNPMDPTSLASVRCHDMVVMKDNFCTAMTVAAKGAGARIVYLDSLFVPPKRTWKRRLTAYNLRAADAVLSYSHTQAEEWERAFALPSSTISRVPYTIDLGFYRRLDRSPDSNRPYVLAVGRDTGRDFPTLARALVGTGIGLKLVSLPYLLGGVDGTSVEVEILQRIPYSQLFDLYAGAVAAVVPLKAGITYPSGIRAVLEAMALGVPVIATQTPVLEEYFPSESFLLLSSAGDAEGLRERIRALKSDPDLCRNLVDRAFAHVTENFGMRAFVDSFEAILNALLDPGARRLPG